MLHEAQFPDPADLGIAGDVADSRRIVLKFGGTSVASLTHWQTIRDILANRLAAGFRPLVVHSALAGVSDSLQQLVMATENGQGDHELADVVARHQSLAADMGLDADQLLGSYFDELAQLTAGTRLVREVSPRVHARILALGELMATTLSAHWLEGQGIPVAWRDARTLLPARSSRLRSERQAYLSATCDVSPDKKLAAELDALPGIMLVPGFIASNANGETVLLGRGGSDTSAAYLAVRAAANRVEVFSDVPGVFSADPRLVQGARLLTQLHYDEAQEIASTGGSVLHPRAIPPLRRAGIPLFLRAVTRPDIDGTVIAPAVEDDAPLVKAVSVQTGITLISLEGIAMWQEPGFLAAAFKLFADAGVSVDFVSTSESNVTVSIDMRAGETPQSTLDQLAEALRELCRVRVLPDCAAVSLVGRRIRATLHQIGPAMKVFEEERVYLVSQAANDLNFSFVTDEDNGYRLVERLHSLLFPATLRGTGFGLSWEEFQDETLVDETPAPRWWQIHRDKLLHELGEREAAYVYFLPEVRAAAERLRSMSNVAAIFFAMKSNSHPAVLRTLLDVGINVECVSPGEIKRVYELFPDFDPKRVLFTPNFAPKHEYEFGFARGVNLTLDNLYPLRHWPEVFSGQDVFVRLDPGQGRGHHEHVKTAGLHAKFGIPLFELDELAELSAAAGCRVVGIHAHSGSGILEHDNWESVARVLAAAAERFPDVRVLDLGGGLGVPERSGDRALDIDRLDKSLEVWRELAPHYELWLEPGRYLVAAAGALLAKVTQTKGKGRMKFVGVATGMNSLIRPALYGAYHEIANLSRIDEAAADLVTVVGPICESADKLGTDRLLPPTQEGDVLLVANAGAYGAVMASDYNLRERVAELTIDGVD
ncbi:MAG: bifunctional aspartate kinase/diaminopimelate decarboxylase [Pseudomonadota bacterium]